MENSGNLDGHLGEGTEIKGTLRFEGSVRIDGKFEGTIVSPATLILGPAARVDAELKVGELEVHGTLRGRVEAAKKVTIHASGKVEAEVKTRRFVVEPGAFYRGQCDMEPSANAAKPSSPSPAPSRGGAAAATSGKPEPDTDAESEPAQGRLPSSSEKSKK